MKKIKILFLGIILCNSLFAVNKGPVPVPISVFTVTNTLDSGAGSLRQAIINANASVSAPTFISFAIGSGVQTIQPLIPLPPITNSYVILDGSSQPGWTSNPVIIIDGSLLPPFTANGITIQSTHHCIIQSLVICNGFENGILITDNGTRGANNNYVLGCFLGTNQTGTAAAPNQNGITISATTNTSNNNNTIGGFYAGFGNLISGNTNGGITLSTNVNTTTIYGNYIGTDITGMLRIPNANYGISIIGSAAPVPVINEQCIGNIIGASSSSSLSRNLISGHTSAPGIWLQANALNTVIKGNFIGVNATGATPLSNSQGIYCSGNTVAAVGNNGSVNGTIIGGMNVSEGNIIGGNTLEGIYLQSNVINSKIQGNYIGTDLTETINIGNGLGAISIDGSSIACINNQIGNLSSLGGNSIVFNGGANAAVFINGINQTPSNNNPILGNSIYDNSQSGIGLQNGATALTSPVITGATYDTQTGCLVVSAIAPPLPASSQFCLNFFVNTVNRSPITEGQIYAGLIPSISSGQTMIKAFKVPGIAVGNWVSATATVYDSSNNFLDTSPFSSNQQITAVAVGLKSLLQIFGS